MIIYDYYNYQCLLLLPIAPVLSICLWYVFTYLSTQYRMYVRTFKYGRYVQYVQYGLYVQYVRYVWYVRMYNNTLYLVPCT